MKNDAEQRIKVLAEQPRTPTTQADRIRAMRPEIDAAREKGHTWPQICEAIGVSRSSLFSALGRSARGSRMNTENVPKTTSATGTPPTPPIQKVKRKPERWKPENSS